MPTILVVDDNPASLSAVCSLLQPLHDVRAVKSGERALHALAHGPLPDLILLDLVLGGIDGFDVLHHIKSHARTVGIPVIIVTARHDPAAEERGFALGASDFLCKPLRPNATLARVQAQLTVRAAELALVNRNGELEDQLKSRLLENMQIQDACILALARLAETRDPETGNHVRRTQGYVRLLCESLRTHPAYQDELTEDYIDLLVKSAPLHDIGKVGIPDHILLKPGPLASEEWVVMKTHCEIGAAAISRAQMDSACHLPFLETAKQIAMHHHERWDGSGYPHGLKGEAIPVAARMMALADVFDALMSRRPYKEPFGIERTLEIIADGRGTHFAPEVVDVLLAHLDEFIAISRAWADTDEDVQAHLHRLQAPGIALRAPAAVIRRGSAARVGDRAVQVS